MKLIDPFQVQVRKLGDQLPPSGMYHLAPLDDEKQQFPWEGGLPFEAIHVPMMPGKTGTHLKPGTQL